VVSTFEYSYGKKDKEKKKTKGQRKKDRKIVKNTIFTMHENPGGGGARPPDLAADTHDGSLLFQNRIDILNTTLLSRITAQNVV